MKVLLYFMRGERERAEAYIAHLRANSVRVSPRDGAVHMRTPQMESGFNQIIFTEGAKAGAKIYQEAGHKVTVIDLEGEEFEPVEHGEPPAVEVPTLPVDPATRPWHELEKAATERLGRAPADRTEAEAVLKAPAQSEPAVMREPVSAQTDVAREIQPAAVEGQVSRGEVQKAVRKVGRPRKKRA